MHPPSEVPRDFEFAFDKRLVDDHLRRDVAQFHALPRLHLFLHGTKVALHPIDAD